VTNFYTELRFREARLIFASPEQVLTELERYSQASDTQQIAGWRRLEKLLLERDDPLIDLGLARYARGTEVVTALYEKSRASPANYLNGRYLRGLRCACLSNMVVGCNPGVPTFPENVIGKEEFARLMIEGDKDEEGNEGELEVLFCNPRFSAKALVDLYLGERLFASVTDERRRRLVLYSTSNPILMGTYRDIEQGISIPRSEGLYYDEVQKAVLTMIAIVPTSKEWLFLLDTLIAELIPSELYTPDQPITPILDRWAQVTFDGKDSMELGFYTDLPKKDEFLCRLAAMYGRHSGGMDIEPSILGEADSADVLARCAFYGKAKLTMGDMRNGYIRDGDVYVLAVLCNSAIYSDSELRELLEREQFKGNRQLWVHYQRRCNMLHKWQPQFDPKPYYQRSKDEKPSDSTELTIFKQIDTKIVGITKTVTSIKTLVIWGFLALVVLVL
jgi:hypothetical protein